MVTPYAAVAAVESVVAGLAVVSAAVVVTNLKFGGMKLGFESLLLKLDLNEKMR